LGIPGGWDEGVIDERHNEVSDALALQRVLGVFERSYRLSSADFYRAHVRDEAPAADLSPWHREVWSGTYRQWLRGRGADGSLAATLTDGDRV
jgi:hypothetical protein